MSGLELRGPRLTLRFPAPDDAQALLELGSDPEVTRFFSWGPYRDVSEPLAFIETRAAARERGDALELVVVDNALGVAGLTGLTELSARDRRAALGTWLGRSFWGSGVNRESKALMCHLAFEQLGLERLTAYAAIENERSQAALTRVGFHREGVLERWHRHGERVYDLAVYRLLRDRWEASELSGTPVLLSGEPPAAWRVSRDAPRPLR